MWNFLTTVSAGFHLVIILCSVQALQARLINTTCGLFYIDFPETLRPGVAEKAIIVAQRRSSSVNVSGHLTYNDKNGERQRIPIQQRLNGGSLRAFSLPVIPVGVPPGQATLFSTVRTTKNGRLCVSAVWYNRPTIASEKILLIETDKSLYRPGQSVFIRIIRLQDVLLPSSGQVSRVLVEGALASGVTVTGQTWSNVTLDNGVAELEFHLPKAVCLGAQDLPGMWTIRVESEGSCTSHTFNVSSFALPNFRVEITGPRYLTYANSPQSLCFNVSIAARYANGLPVEGTTTVDFELLTDPQFWDVEPRPRFTQSIKGMATVHACLPGLAGLHSSLVVMASVTESATSMEQVALPISIPFARHHYNIKLIAHVGPTLSPSEGDFYQRVGTVHPLLPFYFTVYVTYADGLPATTNVTFQASSSPFYKPPEWRWTSEIEGSKRMRFGLLGADQQLQIEATIEGCCFGEEKALVALDVLTPDHAMYNHTLHVNSISGKGEVGRSTPIEVCADITNGMPSQLLVLVKNNGQTVYERVFQSQLLKSVDLGMFAPGAAGLPFPAECKIVWLPVTTNFGMNPTIHIAAHGKENPGQVMQGKATITVEGLTDNRLQLRFSGNHFAKPKERRYIQIVGRPRDVVYYTVVDARVDSLAASQQTFISTEKVAMMLSDASRSACRRLSFQPAVIVTDLVIRSYFPETWLWGKIALGETGRASVAVELPDAITSWTARAFATNPTHRISVAKAVSLAVNQPFYVRIDVTSEVIAGAEISTGLTVFNSGNYTGCYQLSGVLSISGHGRPKQNTVCRCQFSAALIPLSFQASTTAKEAYVCGHASVFEVESCRTGEDRRRFATRDGACQRIVIVPEGQVERSSCMTFMSGETSGTFIRKNISFIPKKILTLTGLTAHIAGDVMALVADKLPEVLSLPVTADQAVKNVILAVHVARFAKQLPPTDSQKRWSAQAEALLQAGRLSLLQYQETQQLAAGAVQALQSPHPSTWLTIHAIRALVDGFYEGFETFTCDALKWILRRQSSSGYVQSLGAQGRHGSATLYYSVTTSMFVALLRHYQASKLVCSGITATDVANRLKRAESWIEVRASNRNTLLSCYELSQRTLLPGSSQKQRLADYTASGRCQVRLGDCTLCSNGACPTVGSSKIGQIANVIIASLAVGKDTVEQQKTLETIMNCALHRLNSLELPDYASFLQAIAAVSSAMERRRSTSPSSAVWLVAQTTSPNSPSQTKSLVLPNGATRRAFFSEIQFDLPHQVTLSSPKTSDFVVMFKKEHTRVKPIQRKIHLSSTISSRSPATCQRFQMEICIRWTGKGALHGVTLDVDLPSRYVADANPISGMREAFVGQLFLQRQRRHVRLLLRKVLNQTRCLQISAMASEFATTVAKPVVTVFEHFQPCFRSAIPVVFNSQQCSGSSMTAGLKSAEKGCPVCGYPTSIPDLQEALCKADHQSIKLRVRPFAKASSSRWYVRVVAIYHTQDQRQFSFRPSGYLIFSLPKTSLANCHCLGAIFQRNVDLLVTFPFSKLHESTKVVTIGSESELSLWTPTLESQLSSILCQAGYCRVRQPFCPAM